MNRPRKIETLREKHEAARLAFETKCYERKSKIMAAYDALDANRLRRQPTREYKDESNIYTISKRLLGCNLGRDLERNYSPAKSVLLQFRVNVVGSLGKLSVNMPGGEEATSWFNEIWAKDCDFRDDIDWSTLLQNILIAQIRDGDALCIVDDNLIEDTGKLLTWETDQILPVSDTILAASDFKDTIQDNGILRDKWGRVVAYCATGKRGINVIDRKDDVTFWKRDQARLLRNPWRLNQGRGIPSLITPSTNFIDLYEILASELISAKRTAKQYAFVKRDNAVTDWDVPADHPEYLPENDGRTAAEVATNGANQATHTEKNYEQLEAFTGGLTDYLDPKDSVEFPKLDHPNAALPAFLETVLGYSGAALGMARAYTNLKAETSYTAFRGEMIMTWVTFYWLQKQLERNAADWIARKVLLWAQRKKHIGPLPDGWERSVSWKWPVMPSVDEARESVAQAQLLKNGSLDYSDILGPDWQTRFKALAAQFDFARELNLPLSVFEQKSGGAAPSEVKAVEGD